MRENEIQREIRLALTDVPGLRLWRANVGRGWVGTGKPIIETSNGRKRVTLLDARPFSSGLPEGFSDLFGFLHGTIARAVFIECKAPRGVLSDAQRAFLEAAYAAGALAGCARSVEDARRILAGERVGI